MAVPPDRLRFEDGSGAAAARAALAVLGTGAAGLGGGGGISSRERCALFVDSVRSPASDKARKAENIERGE
jgi:hypothetical protein